MRLMIVDDEDIIRRGLSTVIDWTEIGLTLLPPAASAEEALERIPEEKPHVLFTDIRMPGMDGIELAGRVRELLPGTETVILTGYDDFGYAREALREGVSDYLLKTSRPEEIIRAAAKAKQRVLERWEARRQESLQTAALRHQLIERLLAQGPGTASESPLPAALQSWFRRSGLCGPEGQPVPLRVLLVQAEGWGDGPFAGLLLGAAENILYELLPCVTLLKADRVAVILPADGAAAAGGQDLARALERLGATLKCSVFAALGGTAADPAGLPASCREAERVLGFRELLGGRGLFTPEQLSGRTGSRTVCSQAEEAELAALLAGGSATGLRRFVSRIVRAELEHPAATPQSLQAFLHSLVLSGHRWLERALEGTSAPGYAPLPEAGGQAEEEVYRRLAAVMERFHASLSESRGGYIPKAVAYIRDHLDDPNLSLQQAAAVVHLSPSHFGEVFKRGTGQTYLEFVTGERMRRAAALLRESPAKVSEVAQRAGYEDIKYFGQLFKKYAGVTPSEYRQSVREGG
ncbi:two-component system response regulator YesN [Paenibacillus mucilaginosus]|uniref:response regulator n=1 Tax=Paenibacillus mucilaginosus TaxID=61624 RepID=UPI003D248ECA